MSILNETTVLMFNLQKLQKNEHVYINIGDKYLSAALQFGVHSKQKVSIWFILRFVLLNYCKITL